MGNSKIPDLWYTENIITQVQLNSADDYKMGENKRATR